MTQEGSVSEKEHATDKRYECPHCRAVDFLDRTGRRYFCHHCTKTVKQGSRRGKRTPESV